MNEIHNKCVLVIDICKKNRYEYIRFKLNVYSKEFQYEVIAKSQ